MPQTENEMQASSDEDCFKGKIIISMGVAVAQLVERLLLIPEVHGLNPVIGKIYIELLFICLLSTVGMAHFFIKNTFCILSRLRPPQSTRFVNLSENSFCCFEL